MKWNKINKIKYRLKLSLTTETGRIKCAVKYLNIKYSFRKVQLPSVITITKNIYIYFPCVLSVLWSWWFCFTRNWELLKGINYLQKCRNKCQYFHFAVFSMTKLTHFIFQCSIWMFQHAETQTPFCNSSHIQVFTQKQQNSQQSGKHPRPTSLYIPYL